MTELTTFQCSRRRFVRTTSAVLISASMPAYLLAQDAPKIKHLSQALNWLDMLEASPSAKAVGTWPLSAVMEHLAQSIEFSLDGFPQQKSPVFQQTLGTAAFWVFKWRGQMSHSLNEAIPGAAALSRSPSWQPMAVRLRKSIERFNAYTGVLAPHFAYGSLSKSDYALAHTMHIANHQDEIVVTRHA